ncbi:hypothetical protein NQ318_005293 [Aromia moschata]|uniref:Uncharacterized protein n=1 Tax=Aromia moschata TaxID=1265417 RepID=A0AAV8XQW6_9CUCU|nr:hypothetical protein NQ318_005293 [Aromia moschata]
MTAITIDNFEEKLPEIKISLQNAKFIGLDLEFSSLYPLKNHSPRDQERELRKRLRNNEVVEKESSCFIQLEEFWKNEGDKFKSWYYKAKDGDHLVIPKLYDSHKYNFEFMYFIHKNFRCRFKNLWTTVENGQFVCEKVTEDKYRTLENDNSLEEQLITNLLGFTNVFRILTSLRKPIIGHNLLQDVLLMIDSLETSLPTSYISFKKLALNLFPVIFDTKVITYSMRKLIPEDKRWTDSSLELLFNFFKNGTGRHLVLNSPAIEIIGNSNYGVFHEAGWDSFCAGYIFIRLAYLNIYHKYPKSKRFVSSELIAGMSEWKNHVNVIRGLVSSIVSNCKDIFKKICSIR